MRLILFICLLPFVNSSTFAQIDTNFYDYSSKTLFIVKGKEKISNKTDIHAEVKLSCINNKIKIQINVIDDKVIIGKDPINSDHIEVYFSLNNNDNQYLKIKNRPERFTNMSKEDFYNFYDTMVVENQGRDLKEIEFEDIERHKNAYGTVHYGIFPSDNKPVMYDLELYDNLFQDSTFQINTSINSLSSNYQRTSKGYSITAEFTVESLKFLKIPIQDELIFMIDVVDVDESKKQETILSTSRHRKWYNPSTFNKIKLKNAIKFNPTALPTDYLVKANIYEEVVLDQRFRWNMCEGFIQAAYTPDYRVVSENITLFNNNLKKKYYHIRKHGNVNFEYISNNDNIKTLYTEEINNFFYEGYGYVINDTGFNEILGQLDTIFYFKNNIIFSTKESYSCHPYGWGAGGADECITERYFAYNQNELTYLFFIFTHTGDRKSHIGLSFVDMENYLPDLGEGYINYYYKLDWNEFKNTVTATLFSNYPFKDSDEIPSNFDYDAEYELPIDSCYQLNLHSTNGFIIIKK